MKEDASGTSAITLVTKAIRHTLRVEIKRTGVTAMMMLKDAPDLPDGLAVANVNRWVSGILGNAPARHVAYVMDKWASLPYAGSVKRGGEPVPKRGARHADGAKRIALTEEMSQSLRAELARTGIDHAALLTGTRNPEPGTRNPEPGTRRPDLPPASSGAGSIRMPQRRTPITGTS